MQDNRLRFPTTEIDFANDVGLTGQDHDDFPAANAQPRWDWLLMWFISLLANQSSTNEPTNYREGTLWLDMSTNVLRIRFNNAWRSLADVISVEETGENTEQITTLQEWYDATKEVLNSAAAESTFSGISTVDGATNIPIPDGLPVNVDNQKPFVWINGVMVDPRNVRFIGDTTVSLVNGIEINEDDRFTVVLKNITDELFHVPSVVLS